MGRGFGILLVSSAFFAALVVLSGVPPFSIFHLKFLFFVALTSAGGFYSSLLLGYSMLLMLLAYIIVLLSALGKAF